MKNEKIFNNLKLKEKRKELRNNMTNAERLLWTELKGKKISGYKFRRQHSIGIYIPDFYCTGLKLAIEVDGPTHCTDIEVKYDDERQKEIENLGIQFLRFTNDEIYNNLYNVIEKIKETIGYIENKLSNNKTSPFPLLRKEGSY